MSYIKLIIRVQNAAVASVLSPSEEKAISFNNGSKIQYDLRVLGPVFITQ